ncbi:MAG: UbiA prenyltransferase family protein [Candidatus Aenigmarchaeota archaeon]|nr:UbiA prenyltransferase family protein [Candidatus Aenigmarchaeota archaeon]
MDLNKWNHFIRPNLWAFGLGIFLIGVLASGIFTSIYFIGALIAVMLCTVSITLNHYYDYETDRKSKQLYRFPVAAGKISKQVTLWVSLFLMTITILLSVLFLNIQSLILVLIANLMVYSYSAPPIRIKERPYLDWIYNGTAYGCIPYYLALFISGFPLSIEQHLLGLVPLFIATSGHILLQVRDIKDDKKGRVKTTSTRLGIKTMKNISGAFVALAGLVIVYLTLLGFLNFLAWVALLCGAFVMIVHKKMKKDVTKSYLKLQLIYVIGGILFILSVIRF